MAAAGMRLNTNLIAGKPSTPPVTLESGEHSRPGSPTSFPDQPTVDDIQWVMIVRDMFQKARAHRRPRVTQWLRNYQILHSRTWSSQRPSWLPDPEVNELHDVVDSWVAWITDQRPMVMTRGFGQSSSPYAATIETLGDDLSHVMESVSDNNDYSLAQEQVVFDAATYGIGWLKTTWDPLAIGGMGDPVIRRVDPFAVYPDPDATSMEDCSYIIEARTHSIAEIERRFGRTVAEKLQRIGYQEQVDEAPNVIKGATERATTNSGAMSPGTSPSYGLPGQSSVTAQTTQNVTVLEGWIREFATYKVNGIDARYTTWRCVVVTGNTVLFNESAVDMWHHGDQPFTRFTFKERGEFYGISLVELLTPIQLSINRLLAAMEHNIWLTGNPVFREGARSGLSRTKITNQPGQRLTTTGPSDDIGWMNPPQLHPMLSLSFVQFYIDRMQKIAGLTAQTQGQVPAGRNSTEVLDDVQEGSFVKIRLALRNLERALKRAYSLAASLVVEFYDTPRMMAVLGPDGEKTSLALKARHFYLPSPGDEPSLPMRFTLAVNAGSSLPTSRIARAQEADVLFAMGAIDGEAVLDAHKWPGRAAITKRVAAATADGTFQPPGARQRTQREK